MPFRSPLTVKKLKNPPPEDTGQETGYLKLLGDKQTPVAVKLIGGEVFRGWVEYFDHNMVRLTRTGAPNLFIFKHEIVYIAEENSNRVRLRS